MSTSPESVDDLDVLQSRVAGVADLLINACSATTEISSDSAGVLGDALSQIAIDLRRHVERQANSPAIR